MFSEQRIAVIGIGGVFPGADGTEKFAEILENGTDCVRAVPKSRLNLIGLEDPSLYVERGYLEHIEYFDHKFFGYSKGEAVLLDPSHRIMLETAHHTLESAGYSRKKLEGTNTGVILAVGSNTYLDSLGDTSGAAYNANEAGMAAARISDFYKLRGKSYTLDTTCSSSLMAIHQGILELQSGECDLVLCGGVNIQIEPYTKKEFENSTFGIIADSYRSRSFDADASGTGVGEGCALVFLKRLDDAIRDHDTVYGVILGTASNHNGGRSNSLIAPSSSAQTECIVKAWKMSGIDPSEIGMAEAHGTGTKIGDPIEIKGLQDAFVYFGKTADNTCAVSAVKSNIGHLGMAAGAASFIKALLSVNTGIKYPLVHFKKGNPLIAWEHSPVYPCSVPEEWNRKERYACITSLGLCGTNVHMVIGNYVNEENLSSGELPQNILKLSAETEDGLERYIRSYSDFLEAHTSISASDLAYSANTGHDDCKYRTAFVFDSVSELKEKLNSFRNYPFTFDDFYILTDGSDMEYRILEKMLLSVPQMKYQMKSFDEKYKVKDGRGRHLLLFQAMVSTLKLAGSKCRGIVGIRKGQDTVNFINGKSDLYQIIEKHDQVSDTGFNSKAFADFAEKQKNSLFIGFGVGNEMLDLVPDKRNRVTVTENNVLSLFEVLYKAGFSIDWDVFYEEKRKRISVPGYPFVKEICWQYIKREKRELPEEIKNDFECISSDPVEQFVWQQFSENLKLESAGLDDDFFELGGNSIMSLKIIQKIKEKYGNSIDLDDFYDYSTVRMIAGHIKENIAVSADNALSAYLKTNETNPYKMQKAPEMDYYPVSDAQKRMWIMTMTNLSDTAYNMPACMEIHGSLDVERFIYAFEKISKIHESFRTTFHQIDGKVVQKIEESAKFSVEVREDPNLDIKTLIKPFDLEHGPLMRVVLVKRNDKHYTAFLDIHHIIGDGTSMAILLKDFLDLYEGREVKAPEFNYRDFTLWQKEFKNSEYKLKQDEYWKKELADLVDFDSTLPLDYDRPEVRTNEGDVYELVFESDFTDRLKSFAGKNKCTLNILLLSAFFLLLNKCNNQETVAIGMPISGRHGDDQHRIVGMFVNMLIIKMNIDPEMRYTDMLDELKRKAFRAYENQDSQFNDVTEMMEFDRKANKNPFFDLVFALQEIDMPELKLPDLSFTSENLDDSSKFDLVCTSYRMGDEIHLSMRYWIRIFKEETVKQMMKDFRNILEQILEAPDTAVSEIGVRRFSKLKKNTSFDDIDFVFS